MDLFRRRLLPSLDDRRPLQQRVGVAEVEERPLVRLVVVHVQDLLFQQLHHVLLLQDGHHCLQTVLHVLPLPLLLQQQFSLLQHHLVLLLLNLLIQLLHLLAYLPLYSTRLLILFSLPPFLHLWYRRELHLLHRFVI